MCRATSFFFSTSMYLGDIYDVKRTEPQSLYRFSVGCLSSGLPLPYRMAGIACVKTLFSAAGWRLYLPRTALVRGQQDYARIPDDGARGRGELRAGGCFFH